MFSNKKFRDEKNTFKTHITVHTAPSHQPRSLTSPLASRLFNARLNDATDTSAETQVTASYNDPQRDIRTAASQQPSHVCLGDSVGCLCGYCAHGWVARGLCRTGQPETQAAQ